MSREVRSRVTLPITTATRTVGVVHLGAVGLGNFLSGIVLGYLVATNQVLDQALPVFIRHLGPFTTLQYAGYLDTFEATLVPLVGLALAIMGFGQILLARAALRSRRFRAAIIGAAVGTLNPAVIPLALIAIVLLVVSHDHFD